MGMGADRGPGADRGRGKKGGRGPARRVLAIVALLAVVAFRLSAGPSSRPGAGALSVPPTRGAGPLRLNVVPATLFSGRVNSVTIASPNLAIGAGAGAEEQDLIVTIPELGWTRRVKPEELRKGLRAEVRPDALGIFWVRVRSDGAEVGARAIAVAPDEGPGAGDANWSLRAGPPHLLDSGAFEVPVYLAVERVHEGGLVPSPIAEGERLTLTDQDSGESFGYLRVPAGQALSNRLAVPMTPRSSYRLVASNKRLHAGPLPLDWSRNGPRLRLSATPDAQDAPAGVDDEATVGVYLSYEGRPALAGQPIPVHIEAPNAVRVRPPSTITIGAGDRVAECRIACPGFGADATITFSEPVEATSCTVRVRFAFPWPYYALAFISGALGALIARRPDRASISWWQSGIEVLIGGATAVALYLAILSGAGGFVSRAGAPGLDVTIAVLIGLSGGLLGLTLIDLILGAARMINGVRVGDQEPPSP